MVDHLLNPADWREIRAWPGYLINRQGSIMHRFYGGPLKVYSDDNGEYVILVKTCILMHGGD